MLERHGSEWGSDRPLRAGGGDGIQWRAYLHRRSRKASQCEPGWCESALRGGGVLEQRPESADGTASAPTVQPRFFDAVKPVGRRRLVWWGEEDEHAVRAPRECGEHARGEVGRGRRGAAACDPARAPERARGAAARAGSPHISPYLPYISPYLSKRSSSRRPRRGP